MTPAEVREAAAVLVEERSIRLEEERPIRLVTEAEACAARASLAAAIRALPLAEEALTPRKRLDAVDGLMLAEERACQVRRIGRYRAGAMVLGEWWPMGSHWEALIGVNRIEKRETFEAARTWVLDTLRAEGWDVVEEGEGDG